MGGPRRALLFLATPRQRFGFDALHRRAPPAVAALGSSSFQRRLTGASRSASTTPPARARGHRPFLEVDLCHARLSASVSGIVLGRVLHLGVRDDGVMPGVKVLIGRALLAAQSATRLAKRSTFLLLRPAMA